MSLPKRDGVNGRDYLPHKPDTAPGVPAHADQCIQEIIRREAPDDPVIGSVMVHIEQYFGGYTRFLHDDSCPGYPLDIVIIPPRLEHNYYTLVTVGMSRYRMSIPEDQAGQELERAELLVNLPKDWKLTETECKDERWYWPIRILLETARFPLRDAEIWLGLGHTWMDGGEGVPFAGDTALCGEILLWPGVFGADSFSCRLPDGGEVNFYQVIPLYREEVRYKLENGLEAFVGLCPDESLEVIDPRRLNVVTQAEELGYDPAEMDDAAVHLNKLRELHLPVDELAAYNPMAVYLGWAMKRGRMCNPFLAQYRETAEAVQAGNGPDLRLFIRDQLGGKLSTQFFDRRGSGFAQWYAQDNRSNPYVYLRDCRNIALAALEGRDWAGLEEKEAAYLLLPDTERNRQSMERLLDERFEAFLEMEFEDDPEERTAQAAEGKPAVISGWDGPLICYASDRIARDGRRVRLMYRVQPEREDMGWESGWAFFSGDEGEVYGGEDGCGASHCGFYDIRDICRIDPDIVPLLSLPYGTARMRDETGAWRRATEEDEEEG